MLSLLSGWDRQLCLDLIEKGAEGKGTHPAVVLIRKHIFLPTETSKAKEKLHLE